jgi:hypothetical protein
MTREDVIRMAQQANIKQAIETPHLLMVHELERFAALVAAAEREACWRLCDALWIEGKDAHDCREAIRARSQS